VLESGGYEYDVEPGDGAFYGPKIDFGFEDALGRVWDGPTVQLDFNMPDRFDPDLRAGTTKTTSR